MKKFLLELFYMRSFIFTMLILLVCIFLYICKDGVKALSLKMCNESIQAIWEKYKKEAVQWIKPTVTMLIIYLVGIVAIIRANFYYIDDLGRNFFGNSGWSPVFSRYISDIISPFLHADTYLTDISPIPQFLAVILMAISSVIILYLITGKKKFNFFEYAAVIPLGLSPYFLECFSYKYDAPYMALSVLAAIVPVLFYKKGRIAYALACITGTLVMCTTYQASSAIFPMLVIVLGLMKWNRKEDYKSIFEFLISSALWYALALIIFKVFLMIEIDSHYVSTPQGSALQLLTLAFDNLKQYIFTILVDFKIEWTIMVILICLSMVYVMVRDSKQHKFGALVLTIISLAVMICISFGIYLLLEKQKFSPRSMYGFGVFIAFVACVVVTAPKAIIGKLICICLSYVFFMFSFTYGNALFVQKTYTDFRIQRAVDDIMDLDIIRDGEDASNITMQIEGGIGMAQAIRNMPQDYQILNRLVPITFRGDWLWGRRGFSYYYGLHDIKWDDSIDLTTYDLPVLEDNIYHTIKGNEKYILLELKE